MSQTCCIFTVYQASFACDTGSMRITDARTPVLRSTSQGPAEAPPEAPAPEPKDVSFLAKGTGAVVGTAAGTAGAVYGGVKGLAQGVMSSPGVVKRGIEVGGNVLRPVGQVTGCTVAAGLIGLTAALGTVATVAAPVAGAVAHGGKELVARAPGMTRAAAAAGARGGSVVGSAVLGAVGGVLGTVAGLVTLPTILYPPFGLRVIPAAVRGAATAGFQGGAVAGRYVGGAVGGLGGGLAGLVGAAATSVPGAARGAVTTGAKAVEFMTNMPELAKETWSSAKEGFGQGAAVLGGTVGAVLGTGAAVVNVPLQGLTGGAQQALEWGGKGYNAVAGQRAE